MIGRRFHHFLGPQRIAFATLDTRLYSSLSLAIGAAVCWLATH